MGRLCRPCEIVVFSYERSAHVGEARSIAKRFQGATFVSTRGAMTHRKALAPNQDRLLLWGIGNVTIVHDRFANLADRIRIAIGSIRSDRCKLERGPVLRRKLREIFS